MQSKLVFLLFIFIFSLTFSSTDDYKKRKRKTKNNILNPPDLNTQDDSQNTVPPSTNNVQRSNTIFEDLLKKQNIKNSIIAPSDLVHTLFEIPNNVFNQYIFSYLSLFELELHFKCTCTKFYQLYEKFLREEKNLLKECLTNKTKFLENINHNTRAYFDFFEKRQWGCKYTPSRVEYANVDCFSEDLILFPKSIRQIIWFTFREIEYKYVLFKNGHLLILKKLEKQKSFVFTSLENDFQKKMNGPDYVDTEQPFKINSFENVRWIEIQGTCQGEYHVYLHKTENFIQYIGNYMNKTLAVCEPWRTDPPHVFLKNLSGYLSQLYGRVTLTEFKKFNGIYSEIKNFAFAMNVKKIESKDFEHYAKDVQFILN